MKVVLSRKGMDSTSGGMASPILPDNTLLSLPIPDLSSKNTYGDFFYKGQNLGEIIKQLRPNFNINQTCHLDPDIYKDIENKTPNAEWKPAFGQGDISAIHLDKFGVGIGDIFLFYGMFKRTKIKSDNTLSYVHNAPIIHIIYGYMKVGEILKNEQEIKNRYPWHPHSVDLYRDRSNNRLYLPDTYGTFQYDNSLVLTKSGQKNRRLWALPEFFSEEGISISWQGNNRPVLKDGYAELNSACRGQEFVVTASTSKQEQNLCDWVEKLIQNH